MFTSESARTEAESFMDEHHLSIDTLCTHCDDSTRRAYYAVTVANKRGSVTFKDYSPGAESDIYDHAVVLGTLIDFTYGLAESSDPDHAHYAQYAEVLEAMTGCDIEYLSSIFDLH